MDEHEAKRRRVEPEPSVPPELPQLPDDLWERIISLLPLSALMSLAAFTVLTRRLAKADPRHASLKHVKAAVLAFRHAATREARLVALDAYRGPRLQLIKAADGTEFASGRDGLWLTGIAQQTLAYRRRRFPLGGGESDRCGDPPSSSGRKSSSSLSSLSSQMGTTARLSKNRSHGVSTS